MFKKNELNIFDNKNKINLYLKRKHTKIKMLYRPSI